MIHLEDSSPSSMDLILVEILGLPKVTVGL